MPRGANRTDTLVPQVQPKPMGQPNGQAVTTPTGLPYGENQALQQAQQTAPLPQAPVGPQGAMQAARQFQMPALGDLHGGTERPNEPVTAGLPGGLMPQGGPPQPPGTIAAMLTKMAAATNSGALSQLAQRAQAAGQ